jgi:hypothetical protein
MGTGSTGFGSRRRCLNSGRLHNIEASNFPAA